MESLKEDSQTVICSAHNKHSSLFGITLRIVENENFNAQLYSYKNINKNSICWE